MDNQDKTGLPIPAGARLVTIPNRRSTGKDMTPNMITLLPATNKSLLIASSTGPASFSIRANPTPPQLITVGKNTLTPIQSAATNSNHLKLSIPTTLSHNITITTNMPNGSRGIVHGTSILSNAVAAAKQQPAVPPLTTSSIPPCTTLTRIPSIPIRTSVGGGSRYTIEASLPATKKDIVVMPPEISVVETTTSTNSTYINPDGTIIKSTLPPDLIHLKSYMAKQNNQYLPPPMPVIPAASLPSEPPKVVSAKPQVISVPSSVPLLTTANRPATTTVAEPRPTASGAPPPLDKLTPDAPAAAKNMINLQIANGVLSNTEGPIRMLTGEPSGPKSNMLSIIPSKVKPSADAVTVPWNTSIEPAAAPLPATTADTAAGSSTNLNHLLSKSPRLQQRTQSLCTQSVPRKRIVRSLPLDAQRIGQKTVESSESLYEPKLFLALTPKPLASLQRIDEPQLTRPVDPPPAMPCRSPTPPTAKPTPTPAAIKANPLESILKRKVTALRIQQVPQPIQQATATCSDVINIEKSNISNICASLFQSLECPEQLDDKSSTKSKSITPEKPPEPKVDATTSTAPDKPKPFQHTAPRTRRPNGSLRGFKYNDPFKHIKWNKMIGYLPNTDLNFVSNEFMMVEVVQRRNDVPINHMFAKSVHDGAFIHITRRKNAQRFDVGSVNKNSQQTNLLKSLARQRAQSQFGTALPATSPAKSGQLINIPVQAGPFNWDVYLEHTAATAAPNNLFYNPFPSAPNAFEVGMKLECIDPHNNSRFCVVSIVQIVGYRLRLSFDGHGAEYMFWCNADSQNIFPAGWCDKTGRKLMPPPNTPFGTTFDWQTYLASTNSRPAPRAYFTHLKSSTTENVFRPGMKLEAEDLKNTRKMCVATVADVLDNRILIHFDGWSEKYDYWVEINSPYIHPVNWHQQNGFNIRTPPNHISPFDWNMYLAATSSKAAPEQAFGPRPPMGFELNMKLEIVDKKNPSLIRPATVLAVVEYEIRVLFDGWPDEYAYWMGDDHPDLHPIRWCERTGHPLEITPKAPKYSRMHNCAIPSCRGIGNVKNVGNCIHLNADECPYTILNWKMDDTPNRLVEYYDIVNQKKEEARAARKRSSQFDAQPDPAEKRPSNRQAESSDSKRAKVDHRPVEMIAETSRPTPKTPSPELIAETSRPIPKTPSPPPSPPPAPVELIIMEPTIKMEILSDEESNDVDSRPIDPPAPDVALDYFNIPTEAEVEALAPSTKSLLADYVPTLRGSYHIWRANSRCLFRNVPLGVDSIRTSNPCMWTVEEVGRHVEELPGLSMAAQRLTESRIDGYALLMLSQQDLVDLFEMRIGPAVKLSNYIVMLREEVNSRWLEN